MARQSFQKRWRNRAPGVAEGEEGRRELLLLRLPAIHSGIEPTCPASILRAYSLVRKSQMENVFGTAAESVRKWKGKKGGGVKGAATGKLSRSQSIRERKIVVAGEAGGRDRI